MSFTLHLPLPPSVNSLFRNVPGRGRVKTGTYKSWRNVADSYALRQKPRGGFPRFERDFEVIVCVPSKMRGDVDNRAKASLDVLRVYGIISDDRHAVRVTVERVIGLPGDECRVTVRPAVPEPLEAA